MTGDEPSGNAVNTARITSHATGSARCLYYSEDPADCVHDYPTAVLTILPSVDTDSDNNGPIERTDREEQIENEQYYIGAYVSYNDNDSNENEIPDYQEDPTDAGWVPFADPDLVQVILDRGFEDLSGMNDFVFEFKVTADTGFGLRYWADQQKTSIVNGTNGGVPVPLYEGGKWKDVYTWTVSNGAVNCPPEIYVEGIDPSALTDTLSWRLLKRVGSAYVEVDVGRVKMTDPAIDLDIAGLIDDEAEEDTVGAVVVKNADNNHAPRKEIILRAPAIPNGAANVVLTVSSAGGSVRVFDAATGGNEITFNGTDNVLPTGNLARSLYVEGSGESASMRDVIVTLAPQQGGSGGDSVRFTVLWVDPISVAFSGSVANDNESRETYRQATIADDYLLGFQEYQSDAQTNTTRWGWGTEARGIVHPASFELLLAPVYLDRNAEFKVFNAGGQLLSSKEFGPDTTGWLDWRDDDPTNSDPFGAIYDLDRPGIVTSAANVNAVRRYRGRFETFAVFEDSPGNKVRASEIVRYYVLFSIKQTAVPNGEDWVLVNDVAGDNVAAYGVNPPLTQDLK